MLTPYFDCYVLSTSTGTTPMKYANTSQVRLGIQAAVNVASSRVLIFEP
jgi:hypothetical protein